MKHLIYFALFIITSAYSQNNFKLITTIDVKADFITTDNQSNVYIVKGDELLKYNKAGKLLYTYSNKNLGKIDFVDASNMMRLLLFYKNFLQVVFLDNTLTLSADPLRLAEINFQQAQLVCSSYNNGFWMYDQQNMELVRMNQSLNTTQQTGNLNILLNSSIQPKSILEYNNKIYLNNPQTGIIIFDVYGTYFKTIPIKNLNYFQVINDWIYYSENKQIKAQNIISTEQKEFKIPESEFTNFRLENGNLTLQHQNKISIYSER